MFRRIIQTMANFIKKLHTIYH